MFRARDFNIAWGLVSILIFVFLCMFIFFAAVDLAQGADAGYYYQWDAWRGRWQKVLKTSPPYHDRNPPPPPQTTKEPSYVVPAKPATTNTKVYSYYFNPYSKLAMGGCNMGTLSYPMPPNAEYAVE